MNGLIAYLMENCCDGDECAPSRAIASQSACG